MISTIFFLYVQARSRYYFFFGLGNAIFTKEKSGKSDICCNHSREILDFDSCCFHFSGHGSESKSQSDNQEESERDENRDGARAEGQKTTREGTEDW